MVRTFCAYFRLKMPPLLFSGMAREAIPRQLQLTQTASSTTMNSTLYDLRQLPSGVRLLLLLALKLYQVLYYYHSYIILLSIFLIDEGNY